MWQKGQSGNPSGRGVAIAQRLVDAGLNPSENVYIPILDKRDPAKELIRLADRSPDKHFKKEIWMFLFTQKYKAVKIVTKPLVKQVEDVTSDEDMLRALEGKNEDKAVESHPSASSVKLQERQNDLI